MLIGVAYSVHWLYRQTKPKCFPYQFYIHVTHRLYGTSFFLVIFHKLVSEGHFLKPFGAMAVVKSIFRQHCITLIILLHIFLQAKQHIFPLSCCNEYPRY